MKQEPGEGGGATENRNGYFKGGCTVGEILLSAREKADISLDDASQETKIPRAMLEYLETDNFEAIPAKVYVKGFLRSYAELLDLDVTHVLSKYEVQTGQTHTSKGDHWEIETEVVEEKLQSPRIVGRLALPAIVIIIAVIVLVRLGMREGPVTEPPSDKSVLEEIGGREGAPRYEPVDTVRDAAPRDEVKDKDQGRNMPPAGSEVAESPAELVSLELELIAHERERIWFDLLTVSMVSERPETTAYDFILLPGESKTFNATDAFVLRKVGNAGGFTMMLNGVRLPPLGERSEVRRDVVITRNDLPNEQRETP
ncbi:MAG TPA: RodZ domain-containing protein [Patescibacteria group bacterium]|nr:RodZ domain-containing protein [Patescibacteria group bacterium]